MQTIITMELLRTVFVLVKQKGKSCFDAEIHQGYDRFDLFLHSHVEEMLDLLVIQFSCPFLEDDEDEIRARVPYEKEQEFFNRIQQTQRYKDGKLKPIHDALTQRFTTHFISPQKPIPARKRKASFLTDQPSQVSSMMDLAVASSNRSPEHTTKMAPVREKSSAMVITMAKKRSKLSPARPSQKTGTPAAKKKLKSKTPKKFYNNESALGVNLPKPKQGRASRRRKKQGVAEVENRDEQAHIVDTLVDENPFVTPRKVLKSSAKTTFSRTPVVGVPETPVAAGDSRFSVVGDVVAETPMGAPNAQAFNDDAICVAETPYRPSMMMMMDHHQTPTLGSLSKHTSAIILAAETPYAK